MNITKLLVVVFIAALCDNVGASQLIGMHNDTKLMDQKLNLDDIIGIIIGNITGPINTMPTLPNNTSPAPSPEVGSVEIVPSPAPKGEATSGAEAPLSGGNISVPSLAPEGQTSNSTEAPRSGGIVGVAPSPIQAGGATNTTEPPLSGGIIASLPSPIVTEAPVSGGAIRVAPSLPPIGGGTEPPLSGDAIGVAPPRLPIGGGTEPPLSDDAIGVAQSLLPVGGGTEPPLSGGGVIGVVRPPQSRDTPATNGIESSIVVNIRMPHVSTEGEIVFTTKNFGNKDGSNGGSCKEP